MKTYKKKYGIFRNKAIQEEINRLDPVKDHCRIVHLLAGYEFPWDGVRALEIALMRTFCSPSISALLRRTGEFHRHGQKRYDDTALLIAEFMQYGYDSERGRAAIAHMNKIHSYYTIANDDYLFVLSTFVFQPFEWNRRYGWRKLTQKEKLASFYFFREVGLRMHLQNIPETMEEFEEFAKGYESRHFTFAETNRQVGDATVNIVKNWMPFFARPLVLPVMTCFFDEKMQLAMGYSAPPALLQKLVALAMAVRATVIRNISFLSYPTFITEQTNRSYPRGYEIEQLGPANVVRKFRKEH